MKEKNYKQFKKQLLKDKKIRDACEKLGPEFDEEIDGLKAGEVRKLPQKTVFNGRG